MKTILNATVFAAAIMATAGLATAQTLKAEIPFTFDTSAGRMQAGAYDVVLSRTPGGQPMLRLYDSATHKSVLAMVHESIAPLSPTAPPVITFQCEDARCVLRSVRDAGGNTFSLPAPKLGAGSHVAQVLLRSDRAD